LNQSDRRQWQAAMTKPVGARYEIAIDGTTRKYRDDYAREAATLLKVKQPHVEVTLRAVEAIASEPRRYPLTVFGISFEFFSQEFQFLDVLDHRLPLLSQIKKIRTAFVVYGQLGLRKASLHVSAAGVKY
jgi:hypothetical protein